MAYIVGVKLGEDYTKGDGLPPEETAETISRIEYRDGRSRRGASTPLDDEWQPCLRKYT